MCVCVNVCVEVVETPALYDIKSITSLILHIHLFITFSLKYVAQLSKLCLLYSQSEIKP